MYINNNEHIRIKNVPIDILYVYKAKVKKSPPPYKMKRKITKKFKF